MNPNPIEHSHILVVDDDAASLGAVEKTLTRAGFQNLLLLNDSTRVFECMAEFRPDLVITDLEMPEVDGLEVVGLARQMTAPGEILPVLVVTGHGSAEAKRRALDAGATDFLSKPFDAPELQARVRNLLRIRSLQRATQAYSANLEQIVAERTRDLERAVEELKESHQMMLHEERLRAFAEMAGGVVHDFNNTLMTITGYSLLLLREPEILADREEAKRTLNIIHSAACDAAHVVDRLRIFYDARDAKEPEGELDLSEIIRDAVEFTHPKWHGLALSEGREIKFEYDLGPVPPVRGRLAELREVFTNLIFNAVDAMPAGGVITCGTRCRGAEAVIEVVDTGMGMSTAVRSRCLDAFFTTKGEKGTGLGLAMVASIVQRHGGKMEIESEPGAGTMVRIRLPLGDGAETPEQEAPASEEKPLRILVVDDDPHMRNVVTRLLTCEGHTVSQAGSGIEALAQAERESFDLMLTDHAMPGINGIELASLMRGVDPRQRVILFTGYPVAPRPMPADIACVLKKPAEPRELRAAISRAMAA